MDRSAKAADLPDVDFDNKSASGGGSRGTKGWTGDGKGPQNPDEDLPKNKRNL